MLHIHDSKGSTNWLLMGEKNQRDTKLAGREEGVDVRGVRRGVNMIKSQLTVQMLIKNEEKTFLFRFSFLLFLFQFPFTLK